MRPLDPVEIRVLGCLIEKERTVPDTYPMTLNGLRTTCNQSTSREPITSLSDGEIVRAVEALKDDKLVRMVHASHGACRTTKYRQVLDETLELDAPQVALARAAHAARPAVGRRAAHAQRPTARVRVADRRRGVACVARVTQRTPRDVRRPRGRASATTAGPISSAMACRRSRSRRPVSPVRPRTAPRRTSPTPDLLARVAALEAKVADLEPAAQRPLASLPCSSGPKSS